IRDVIIGHGSFGVVVKAFVELGRSGKHAAAVKLFTVDRLSAGSNYYKKTVEHALAEARVLADVYSKVANKQNIVQLYGVALGQLSSEQAELLQVAETVPMVALVMRYEAGEN
ncbi:MAG: hypothetical protein ACK56F_26970, partial [bacterium]